MGHNYIFNIFMTLRVRTRAFASDERVNFSLIMSGSAADKKGALCV